MLVAQDTSATIVAILCWVLITTLGAALIFSSVGLIMLVFSRFSTKRRRSTLR